jgi:hypothetical protein
MRNVKFEKSQTHVVLFMLHSVIQMVLSILLQIQIKKKIWFYFRLQFYSYPYLNKQFNSFSFKKLRYYKTLHNFRFTVNLRPGISILLYDDAAES